MVSRFCTRCGQLLPSNATTCPRCNAPVTGVSPGTSPAPTTLPATDGAAAAKRTCANCRAAMRWIGHYSLRATGATSPPGGLPAVAANGAETLLPFSLYYCQTCGKFDFYYPGT